MLKFNVSEDKILAEPRRTFSQKISIDNKDENDNIFIRRKLDEKAEKLLT